MARSTARKRALNTLYEADEKGQDILSLLDERIEYPGAQTPLPSYAVEIVKGTAEHLRDIDFVLGECSTGWRVKRMAVVDRNIARIAAWEILFNDEVPPAVAIDEALSLAKQLSDDEAPAFLHGVLSAVSSKGNILISARAAAKNMSAENIAAEDADAEKPDAQETEAGKSEAEPQNTEPQNTSQEEDDKK